MEVLRDGKFSLPIKDKELMRGIRRDKNQSRNKNTFTSMTGMIGKEGSLVSLPTLTIIDTSIINDSFPYPQLFVLTNVIIVCSSTKVYELIADSLVEMIEVSAGRTWKVIDFFDYIYMSNEKVAVIRDASSRTYSITTTLPTFSACCDYNGQVLIGAPDVEPTPIDTVTLCNPVDPTAFIITINTENTGTITKTIMLPIRGTDIIIAWGDGNTEIITQANIPNNTFVGGNNVIHTYAETGIYDISITGGLDWIYFNYGGDRRKVTLIKQWGSCVWSTMENAFYGCINMTCTATDSPNLSVVESFVYMFRGCTLFNTELIFDTTHITDMTGMFYECSAFNQPVDFDTGNVLSFNHMFNSCVLFNQPLSFDTSSATDMHSVFYGCVAFDQDISAWDVSNVDLMTNMFNGGTLGTTPLLSVTNYDALLLSWSAKVPAGGGVSNFHGGISSYTDGGAVATARQAWVDKGWTLTDFGPVI